MPLKPKESSSSKVAPIPFGELTTLPQQLPQGQATTGQGAGIDLVIQLLQQQLGDQGNGVQGALAQDQEGTLAQIEALLKPRGGIAQATGNQAQEGRFGTALGGGGLDGFYENNPSLRPGEFDPYGSQVGDRRSKSGTRRGVRYATEDAASQNALKRQGIISNALDNLYNNRPIFGGQGGGQPESPFGGLTPGQIAAGMSDNATDQDNGTRPPGFVQGLPPSVFGQAPTEASLLPRGITQLADGSLKSDLIHYPSNKQPVDPSIAILEGQRLPDPTPGLALLSEHPGTTQPGDPTTAPFGYLAPPSQFQPPGSENVLDDIGLPFQTPQAVPQPDQFGGFDPSYHINNPGFVPGGPLPADNRGGLFPRLRRGLMKDADAINRGLFGENI